jgi:GMP synthase-like glutamine amidotransferase
LPKEYVGEIERLLDDLRSSGKDSIERQVTLNLGGKSLSLSHRRRSFHQGSDPERKSIVGICLGAQLVAKALGAKVSKAPVKEIGWYDVSLTEEGSGDPWFGSLPKTFRVFQWHEDTFEIPRRAKLLASSTAVPHQAFRYGDNAYGLQFHPEVVHTPRGVDI